MLKRQVGRFANWIRSMPDPTLSGRIALTFLVIAFFLAVLQRNNQVLFITCVVWTTVILSMLMTHFAIPKLSVTRDLPERVHAGAPFDVRLRVTNRSRWRPALGLGFLDALQVSEPGGVTRGPTLPVLPPKGVVEIAYEKRIHRRGVYTVVNTLAATRFPFGIFERRVLVQSPTKLIVLPSLGRLRRGARRDLSTRTSTQQAVRHAREGAEEFERLREYRPGDNPRHIHWKTSARVGELVRMVVRDEAAEDLTIFLDTFVGTGLATDVRQRSFEKAISCAATLLADAAQRGRRAEVVFCGGVAAHPGSHAGLLHALETLAGIEAAREPVERAIETAKPRRGATAVLLSLAGKAPAARRAAKARGMKLRVWDVAAAGFEDYFARH